MDETTEDGTLVETAAEEEAKTTDETPESDGHGAQAVPVGSVGNEHSDNGAVKKRE